ncbi:MAG: MBL fold metallo-hydrolase [Bacteroidetes bacterium]|nr:MBL fold metallo-hydrolase [Bacteroidota bacterium]
MIKTEKYVFNNFQVNSFILYDDSGECVIIDAACYDEREKQQVMEFIEGNSLKLVRNLNTHCHIDHVLGNGFISEIYGIRPEYHEASVPLLFAAPEIAASFGFVLRQIPEPARYLQDGETIRFGSSELKVLYTPGHADGSVCFYNKENGFVITGDVLFRDTIGRTDLPTGNFDLLMKSIREKLFTLPDDTKVYAGHGPETTIGYEKMNNPFIR